MNNSETLTIGIAKNTRILQETTPLFEKAGYPISDRKRKEIFIDPETGIQFLFLRGVDIMRLLARKQLDYALVGRDIFWEFGGEKVADEVLPLGVAKCALEILTPPESKIESLWGLDGRKIITSYPNFTQRWAEATGVNLREIEKIDGCLEVDLALGLSGADAGSDLVDSGETAKRWGLNRLAKIFDSEAILAGRYKEGAEFRSVFETLRADLEEVLTARDCVLLKYNLPNTSGNLATAAKITPGVNGPTVSPISSRDGNGNAMVAVEVVIPRKDERKIRRELRALGADGVIAFSMDRIGAQPAIVS
jgi:ATP phosphoribosyltransferase